MARTAKSDTRESQRRDPSQAEGPHGQSYVVIGDGWSALGLCGFLSAVGRPVTWIAGTGSRIGSPLPTLEAASDSPGAETWTAFIQALGIDAGELQTGSFLREFRNKGFREPAWMRAPTPEGRLAVRDEILGSPERLLVPLFEARFTLGLAEIEARAREKVVTEGSSVRRVEGVPVVAIEIDGGRVQAVRLASGERVACGRVFYADRWGEASLIEGIPKGLALTRKRDPMGVLQAVFTHDAPMAVGVQEGFFSPLHQEAGEEVGRHVWGYFSSRGDRSYWTLCISTDEAEDNHAIAKKLRRMKNVLEKMFSSSEWMPPGKPDFMSNVKEEKVRFEESVVFAAGDPPFQRTVAPGIEGLDFLTDGYGPTRALHQVRLALEGEGGSLAAVASAPVSADGTNAEAEGAQSLKTTQS